jgi:hypothetical protein
MTTVIGMCILIFMFLYSTLKEKVLVRMLAGIPKIESVLNFFFFTHAILICNISKKKKKQTSPHF